MSLESNVQLRDKKNRSYSGTRQLQTVDVLNSHPAQYLRTTLNRLN